MTEPFVADLKGNTRTAVMQLLNARLADAIDPKLAIKQAHWNVRGRSLRCMNCSIVERLEEHGDTMAERAVQIWGLAAGSRPGRHRDSSNSHFEIWLWWASGFSSAICAQRGKSAIIIECFTICIAPDHERAK